MSEPTKKRKTDDGKKKKEVPSVNPSGGCDVWLPKKNRFCRFEKSTGRYCGHHIEERVPCPVNPNHTIKRDQLDEHVIVCSDRHMLPPEDEPYYEKGVNEGIKGENPPKRPQSTVTLTPDLLEQQVIEIIESFTLPSDIENCRYTWPPGGAVEEKDETAGNDDNLKHDEKHEHQIGSLLGHLHAEGVLPSRSVSVKLKGPVDCEKAEAEGENEGESEKYRYMEFGAGKGALSVSIARVLYGEGTEGGKIVLIDRSNFRRKCIHPNLDRVFIDLRDLKLQTLMGTAKPVVGFSKHLCGVATDYTLSCFLNSPDVPLACLSIALCCHHRCIYKDYINRPFLTALGIYDEHFKMLTKISSWAVDGGGRTEVESHKTKLGRKAKRLLDFGRMQKMTEQGYKCKLLHYIDTRHTPENCLMLISKTS